MSNSVAIKCGAEKFIVMCIWLSNLIRQNNIFYYNNILLSVKSVSYIYGLLRSDKIRRFNQLSVNAKTQIRVAGLKTVCLVFRHVCSHFQK